MAALGIDPTVPSLARIYDYMLGGRTNFAADREAADKTLRRVPGVRELARQNRDFLVRVVTFLCREAGIRQFLDIGSGLPTEDNVHQIAQREHADARVAYVDNDPVVLRHAQSLLLGDQQTSFVRADVRNPDAILTADDTLRLIDFDRPLAVLLVAILHFISDEDDPHTIIDRLISSMAPGSYLVISHITLEGADPELRALIESVNPTLPAPVAFRSTEEIADLFRSLDLIAPGLVEARAWRPELETAPGPMRGLGGVAFKASASGI